MKERKVINYYLIPAYDDEAYTSIVAECDDGVFFSRELYNSDSYWRQIIMPEIPQDEFVRIK